MADPDVLELASKDELIELIRLIDTNRKALEVSIAKQNQIVNAARGLVLVARSDIHNSDQIDEALSKLIKVVENG